MRKIKVTLSDGRSTIAEFDEGMTQDEVFAELETMIPEGTTIAGAEQVSDQLRRTPEQIRASGEEMNEEMEDEIERLQGGNALETAFPRTTREQFPESVSDVPQYLLKQPVNTALDLASAPGRVLSSIYDIAKAEPEERAGVAAERIGATTGETIPQAIGRDPLNALLFSPGGMVLGGTRLATRSAGEAAPFLVRWAESLGKGALEGGLQGAITLVDRPDMQQAEMAIPAIAGAITHRYGVTGDQARQLAREIAHNQLIPSAKEIAASGKRLGVGDTDVLLRRGVFKGGAGKAIDNFDVESAKIGARQEAATSSPLFSGAYADEGLRAKFGAAPSNVRELFERFSAGEPVQSLAREVDDLPEGVYKELLKRTFATTETNVPQLTSSEITGRLAQLMENQPAGVRRDLESFRQIGIDTDEGRKTTLKSVYDFRKFFDKAAEEAGAYAKSVPDLAPNAGLYRDARRAINDIILGSVDVSRLGAEDAIAATAKGIADDEFARLYGRGPVTGADFERYEKIANAALADARKAAEEFSGAQAEYRELMPWLATLERRTPVLNAKAPVGLLARTTGTPAKIASTLRDLYTGAPVVGAEEGLSRVDDAQRIYDKAARMSANKPSRGKAATAATQATKTTLGSILVAGGAMPIQVQQPLKQWNGVEDIE